MKYRTEFDSLGKIKVPGDKYWGASTQRSNKYFDIGDFLVRPILIQSIGVIKKAAAIVNAKNKDLDKCFDEVQRPNMSKLGEDGKPIYNEHGKVMKGPKYFQPDLGKFIK